MLGEHPEGRSGKIKVVQSGSLDNSKGSDATAIGWNWFADSLATQQAKYPREFRFGRGLIPGGIATHVKRSLCSFRDQQKKYIPATKS
jgi:hypothetical protein